MNGFAITSNNYGDPFNGDDDKIKNPLNKLASIFNMKKMPENQKLALEKKF
jgi:hypothetical protein